MGGEQTPHTAQPVNPGDPHVPWRVSWLPGRSVSRAQAVSALLLADAVAVMQHEGQARSRTTHTACGLASTTGPGNST